MTLHGGREAFVFKDVPEVPVTRGAQNLHATHAKCVVDFCLHRSFVTLIERWPATSGIEFGLRAVQRRSAPGAHKVPFFRIKLIVHTRARGFRALLTQHLELHFVQRLGPLAVGLIHARDVDELVRRRHDDDRGASRCAAAGDGGRRRETVLGRATSRRASVHVRELDCARGEHPNVNARGSL